MRNHSRTFPTRLLAAALMATQAACGGWRPAQVAPRQLVQADRPTVVRVTATDGRQWTIHDPAVQRDSLVGLHQPNDRWDNRLPVAVALSDIQTVETLHGPGTALLLGGITLVLVAIAMASYPDDLGGSGGSGGGFELGSCPVVESWDGTDWRLDSGTYSGAIAGGLARAEVDNLEYAVPERGVLRLRVRTEPGETDHIDAVEVLAVTHPAEVRPVPDATGALHAIGRLTPPARATDDRGRDARGPLARRDAWAWESVPNGRDTAALADIRSWVELAFLRPKGASTGRLVLDAVTTPWAAYLNRAMIALNGTATSGWYRLMSTPLVAAAFTAVRRREAWLAADVRTRDGWARQGYYSEAGGEVGREQALLIDLSAVAGDTVVVRLESAPSFWLVDYAGMAFGPEAAMRVDTVAPTRALASDGRDVLPLLARADRVELAQESGAWVDLAYAVPSPSLAHPVSYLVRTTGWYRVHTDESGKPQAELLARLATEPWAISRLSTARLNEALAGAGAGPRDR